MSTFKTFNVNTGLWERVAVQGPTGATGPAGATGATGPAGAAGSGGGGTLFVIKNNGSGSESRISTTTVSPDLDLKVTLSVGVWRVTALLEASGPTTGGDIKTSWTFSGGATYQGRNVLGPNVDTSDDTNTTMITRITNLGTAVPYGLANGANPSIHEELHLQVTAAGLLRLQWAQNTSSGSPTSLNETSRLYATLLTPAT